MVDLPKVRYLKATSTQGPHSHMLMMGGPTEVHILYPKKSQLQNLSTQKKIPTFFSIPRKIPQCFCISKFYYLPSGKLKHANFNFGFGQKQNYTKTNTKSVHVCYSVSSSYLLRQLYRRYSLWHLQHVLSLAHSWLERPWITWPIEYFSLDWMHVECQLLLFK